MPGKPVAGREFKLTLPIEKFVVRSLDAAGDYPAGEYLVIEGWASDSSKDKLKGRMTPNCVVGMVDCVNAPVQRSDNAGDTPSTPVIIDVEHSQNWTDNIGYAMEARAIYDLPPEMVAQGVTPPVMYVKNAVDLAMSHGQDLKRALERDKKLGFSIYGKVVEGHKEVNRSTGEVEEIFEKIDLKRIAITGRPVNDNTWMRAVARSMEGVDLEEEEMVERAAGSNLPPPNRNTNPRFLDTTVNVPAKVDTRAEGNTGAAVSPVTRDDDSEEHADTGPTNESVSQMSSDHTGVTAPVGSGEDMRAAMKPAATDGPQQDGRDRSQPGENDPVQDGRDDGDGTPTPGGAVTPQVTVETDDETADDGEHDDETDPPPVHGVLGGASDPMGRSLSGAALADVGGSLPSGGLSGAALADLGGGIAGQVERAVAETPAESQPVATVEAAATVPSPASASAPSDETPAEVTRGGDWVSRAEYNELSRSTEILRTELSAIRQLITDLPGVLTPLQDSVARAEGEFPVIRESFSALEQRIIQVENARQGRVGMIARAIAEDPSTQEGPLGSELTPESRREVYKALVSNGRQSEAALMMMGLLPTPKVDTRPPGAPTAATLPKADK